VTDSPLLQLLERLSRGETSVADAARQIEQLSTSGMAETADASVDIDRQRRCGFPEVVYSRGKTIPAMVEIFHRLLAHGQKAFATLVSEEQAAALLKEFPHARHNPVARTMCVLPPECENVAEPGGRVVVVTAGTSDRPVAEEACETLHWMGCETDLIVDVGVAGPQRLRQQLHRLRDADAVIVVAGMEGALPSVVGGYVDCPIVAVPTSVGYGASFGGVAALLGMLNSCASNVTVVNIDSGFKGGYVAGLIARRVATARRAVAKSSREASATDAVSRSTSS